MLDKKIREPFHADSHSFAETEEESSYVKVGQRLRHKREWQHQSLLEIARELKITEKSLRAIEEHDLEKLPALVYARGFVKLYAEYVGLDPKQLVADFTAEYQVAKVSREQKITPQQLRSFRRAPFTLTPKLVAVIVGIFVALMALSYLFFEVRGFTRAPALSLDSPADNTRIKGENVSVQGKTDPSAEVKINGEKTFVQNDGSFSEVISVGPGLNKIRVSAKSIGGKERVLEREVLVEQAEPTPGPSVSPAASAEPTPANGMTSVKIKAMEDVWVAFLQDGKQVFSDILKKDEEKQFTGKAISVSAGKGNKVQVQQDNGEWLELAKTPGAIKNVVFKAN